MWTEFDSLREYVPGDSIKSIDWKSTAKLWDVHVKNYEEEKDLKILFIIDNTDSLTFGSEKITKKECVEEIFFLLAQSAILTGHSIWVKINSEFLDFKKWEENIIKTIKILHSHSPLQRGARGGIDKSGKEIKQGNIKNSLIFHITDSLTPNITNLKYLNILNEIVYINIFDYFENNLSEDTFEVNLWNTFKNVLLWKKKKLVKYKALREHKIHALQKTLRKQNIEYLSLDNHDDIFLEFYKFFNSYKT